MLSRRPRDGLGRPEVGPRRNRRLLYLPMWRVSDVVSGLRHRSCPGRTGFGAGCREPGRRRRCECGAIHRSAELLEVLDGDLIGVRIQTELLAQLGGQFWQVDVRLRCAGRARAVDVHAQVRVGGVGHRDEVDHHPIAVRELESAVEVQVGGELCAFHQGGDGSGIEVRRAGEVDSDPQDGHRRPECGGVPCPGEASATTVIGDRPHASVWLTGAEVVTGGA